MSTAGALVALTLKAEKAAFGYEACVLACSAALIIGSGAAAPLVKNSSQAERFRPADFSSPQEVSFGRHASERAILVQHRR